MSQPSAEGEQARPPVLIPGDAEQALLALAGFAYSRDRERETRDARWARGRADTA